MDSNDSGSRSHPLASRRLRASNAYRLVEHEQLSAEQQESYASLTRDRDHYGLLVPAAPGLGVKAVCCDTALLWLTLREPGPMPRYVRVQHGEEGLEQIAAMVLDGILEVEDGDAFLSGPQAQRVLVAATPPSGAAGQAGAAANDGDRIAALSVGALRYGQALGLSDVHVLAARLYQFNTVPVGPRWLDRFTSREVEDEALGIGPGSPAAALLRRAYRPLHDKETERCWRSFGYLGPVGEGARGACTYKLYVSPHPRSLATAVPEVIRVFSDLGVLQFKIGTGAQGLLRPDKIVAYFPDRAMLDAVSAALAGELSRCEPQGVPFTAALTPDGLLSWAVDPPVDAAVESWHGRESWRLWIVRRLARFMLDARRHDGGVEPWQYALDRVRLEGLDTRTWTISTTRWDKATPGAARAQPGVNQRRFEGRGNP